MILINIQQRIYELKEKIILLQNEIDSLQMIKQKDDCDFKSQLVGKYFTDGTRYIKILKQFNSTGFSVLFITDYFNARDKINDFFSIYMTDIYVENIGYFDNFEKITEEQFLNVLDIVKAEIKDLK